ncbi:MAG TPA: hypothetical protein VJX66_11305, partial [Amycolatopsis sp.]|nr:hypothetical protein [Amycolatopsis sp.]
MTPEPEPDTSQDMRLVPAAVTGWLAALGGLLLGLWAAIAVGAVAVIVALAVLMRRRPRLRGAAVMLLALGALAA